MCKINKNPNSTSRLYQEQETSTCVSFLFFTKNYLNHILFRLFRIINLFKMKNLVFKFLRSEENTYTLNTVIATNFVTSFFHAYFSETFDFMYPYLGFLYLASKSSYLTL